jgi:DNA polymerase V
VINESCARSKGEAIDVDIFSDYEETIRKYKEEHTKLKKERQMQEALISVKKRFGKNAILKGLNYAEGATAKDRNKQIGGHNA